MGYSYEDVVSKIKEEKGLSEEEIESRVTEKRNTLNGLISKEGAVHVIANELGMDLLKEVRERGLKIGKLQAGMRVGVVGKVVKLYEVRSFNKNGRAGKVGSFLIGDDSGLVRIVLWDVNHIKLMENGEIKEGAVVKISTGAVRENNGYTEMHLGNYSELKINPEGIGEINVIEKRVADGVGSFSNLELSRLDNLQEGQTVAVMATIVQMFEPRSYEGCGECGRKIVDGACKEHPTGEVKKIPILNFYIDDGSDVVRAVAFREQTQKVVGLDEAGVIGLVENGIEFEKIKSKVLGEQMIFGGRVNNNNYFNKKELMIRGVNNSVDEMVKKVVV